MFAYEVLNINAHAVDDMNSNRDRETPILKGFPQTREQISKMRAKVIKNAGIYMGKKISLEEFDELYYKYAPDGMEKKDFALRVLGIQNDFFVRFERGKSKEATVWQSFPVEPEYIELIRRKVIIVEKLYREQKISVEQFDRMHAEHGGFLSKEIFANEVLDISSASLRAARLRGQNCTVLTGIEIPEEYVIELRKRIISENNIQPNNQMLTLEEMRDLRLRYAPLLSEYRFITKILGIKKENYFQLTAGTTKKNYVFPEPIPIDVLELRQKIIQNEHLHYDDLIDYYRLDELRRRYAPTMREVYFARFVLDISQINLDNIRNEKGRAHTRILLDETLPTSKEIDELRILLVGKKKIKEMECIDYSGFQKLYDRFGGIMPEDMFALQVMEITQKELNKMKKDKTYKTNFLMEARKELEEENKRKAQKKLLTKEKRTRRKVLQIPLSKRAKKVIEECGDSPKDVKTVQDYITECELKFEEGSFEPGQLRLYAEALFFIEADSIHIEKFARTCILFEEYDFGHRSISRHLEYNEKLKEEDKIKLSKLRDNMRYEVRKQQAEKMILRGIWDVNRIMYMTGLLEVDALAIIKKAQIEKKNVSSKGVPEEH